MDDVKDAAEFMKKAAETVGERLIAQMRELAAAIDRSSRVGNLGNNSVVNALCYALDSLITDMSTYKSDKDPDKVFKEIHHEHQHLLHGIIAKHSTSGASLLIDIIKEEHDGGG